MEDETRGVGDLQTAVITPLAPPTVQGEVMAGRLVRYGHLPRGHGRRITRVVDSGQGQSR